MHLHKNGFIILRLSFSAVMCGTMLTPLGCYSTRPSRRTYHSETEAPIQRSEFSAKPASILHPEFSATRVEALREGLTTKHVRLLFGPPDAIVTRMYGTATPKPWEALVYQYKMASGRDDLLDEPAILLLKTNEIIFSTSGEEPVVNNFNLRVTYPDAQAPEYAQVPKGFNDLPTPHDRFARFLALVDGASDATLAGNCKEAIDKCHRALELASGDEQRGLAVKGLGIAYLKNDTATTKAQWRELIGLCDGLPATSTDADLGFLAAKAKDTLGLILLKEGAPREAELLLQQAALGYEAILTTDTTNRRYQRDLTCTLVILATIQQADKDSQRIRTTLARAHKVVQSLPDEWLSDPAHMGMFMEMFINLAFTGRNIGGFDDESESLLRRTIRLSDKFRGKKDDLVYRPHEILAMFYTVKGKFAAAEPLYEQAITRCTESFGEDIRLADILEHYGTMLGLAGRAEDARKVGQLAQAIRLKHGQATQPTTQTAPAK